MSLVNLRRCLRKGVFVLLFFPLFLCSSIASACDKVVVAASIDNPPISYVENDRIVGVGIELFQKLVADLPVAIEILGPTPWPRVMLWTEKGKIDVVVGARKVETQMAHMDFVEPFFTEKALSVFLKKENQALIKTNQSLEGFAGGVTNDEEFNPEFTAYAEKKLSLYPVNTVDQNIRKLMRNRLDYVIAPLLPTIHLMNKQYPDYLGKITFLSDPVSVTHEYIGLSKKSKCKALKKQLQDKLQKVKSDGTFDKWLGESLSGWTALDWYMQNRE